MKVPSKRYPQDALYIKKLAQGVGCAADDLSAVMGLQELQEVLGTATKDDFLHPTKRFINLHTHTTASDGHLPPEQYIDAVVAYQKKYLHGMPVIIALTDHDTLSGLPVVLKTLAQKKPKNIRFVLGCELSTIYKHPQAVRPIDFEVLAYGVNPFDEALTERLKKQSQRRIKYLKKVFAGL